jgi:hypothetical protein
MTKRKANTVIPLCESDPEATQKWLTDLLVRSAVTNTRQPIAHDLSTLSRVKSKTAQPPKSQSKYNRPYRGPQPKSRFVAYAAIVDQAKMDRLGIEWATQTDTGKILMKADDWERAEREGAVQSVITE